MSPTGMIDAARGEVRAAFTDPLVRVLRWMVARQDTETGALVCPVHKIEHTGKSAGAVVLAVELAKHAGGADRDALFEIARGQCERIAGRLEREGDSTCFTFRPGRHDPYNCSNSVIDGGACSDALAACVTTFGDRLEAQERERFVHASVLHAQTYLRYAIVDKGVPAQCAWAMTGAAQAYRLSGHEVLRHACTVGERRIADRQGVDGSFPYHPLDWGGPHPGAADASAFYQSRVNTFLSFSLEAVLGADDGARADSTFARGVDFLHGLVGPDGIKVGAVEAKPWYWGAEYEVASHPFDIAALATEWRRTRAPRAARALRASWGAWAAHLGPDGAPSSHTLSGQGFGGEGALQRRASYQCPFFWAAHACWIARVLPELAEVHDADLGTEAIETGWRHFEDVDLARLDTPELVAWVRGARPPGNASNGSPAGGLLRVFSRGAGRDLFVAGRFERRPEAAWSGSRGLLSLSRGWRAGAKDLRFSRWLLRNQWRSGAYGAALREPLRAVRRSVLDFASPAVSTAFDRTARLTVADGVARLAGPLAFRDGAVAGGMVERQFRALEGGLEVTERSKDVRGFRGLWFRPPLKAVVLESDDRQVRYRFGGGDGGVTG